MKGKVQRRLSDIWRSNKVDKNQSAFDPNNTKFLYNFLRVIYGLSSFLVALLLTLDGKELLRASNDILVL